MNTQPLPKLGKLKLTGRDYAIFKHQVHTLDKWKCLVCVFFGRSGFKALTVHHLIKRSRLRLDVPQNAISACAECHRLIELNILRVTWHNSDTREILVEVLKPESFKFD